MDWLTDIAQTHDTSVIWRAREIQDELSSCEGWYFAGGFAVALLEAQKGSDTQVGDIDIFFENKEAFDAVSEVYSKLYTKGRVSKYAETYNNNVQLITFQYGLPHEVLNNFDINICRVAYVPYEERYVDMRGENPYEMKIMNPTNYSLVQRIKKYVYRKGTIDLAELKKLRELMTSDGLSELDVYGEKTLTKTSHVEFFSRISDFKNRLVQEDYYKLFEDIDMLEMVIESKAVTGTWLGHRLSFLDMKDIPYVANDNQKYAVLLNNDMLKGGDLSEALDKYPEYFI